jgi:hypothetical protein
VTEALDRHCRAAVIDSACSKAAVNARSFSFSCYIISYHIIS